MSRQLRQPCVSSSAICSHEDATTVDWIVIVVAVAFLLLLANIFTNWYVKTDYYNNRPKPKKTVIRIQKK